MNISMFINSVTYSIIPKKLSALLSPNFKKLSPDFLEIIISRIKLALNIIAK